MFHNEVPLHQPFHRRLLSEYDSEITLDNYIPYFELKKLAKKIENNVAKLSGYKDSATQRYAFHRSSSVLFPGSDAGGGAAATGGGSDHLHPPSVFHPGFSPVTKSIGTSASRQFPLSRSPTSHPHAVFPDDFSPSGIAVGEGRGGTDEGGHTPGGAVGKEDGHSTHRSGGMGEVGVTSAGHRYEEGSPLSPSAADGRRGMGSVAGSEGGQGGSGTHRASKASHPHHSAPPLGPPSGAIISFLCASSHADSTVVSATLEEEEVEINDNGDVVLWQHHEEEAEEEDGDEAANAHEPQSGKRNEEEDAGKKEGSGVPSLTPKEGEKKEEEMPVGVLAMRGRAVGQEASQSRSGGSSSAHRLPLPPPPPTDGGNHEELEEEEDDDDGGKGRVEREGAFSTPRAHDRSGKNGRKSPLSQEGVKNAAGPNRVATLLCERQVLQKDFFRLLRHSFDHVCVYMKQMLTFIVEEMKKMRTLSEKQIRAHENRAYLEQLYLQIQKIENYSCLNVLALQRIFYKFHTRCAADSLTLQAVVGEWNVLVQNSPLVKPNVDVRGFLLELISVYGIVYALSYEESIARLRQFEARQSTHSCRILGLSASSFLSTVLPMQKSFGSFSIRILAGNASKRLEKALSGVLRCPRFCPSAGGATIASNGEVEVVLSESVRGDDVYVVQSTVHTPESHLSMNGTLMELAILLQNVRLAGARRVTAVVPYMGYTRDTVSISAIAELLQAMGCHHLITLDLNSEQVEGCFSIPMEVVSAKTEFVRWVLRQLTAEGNDFTRLTIVAPRDVNLRRAKEFADAIMREGKLHPDTQFVSVCTAVRRQKLKRDRHPVADGGGRPTSPPHYHHHPLSSPPLTAVVPSTQGSGGKGVTGPRKRIMPIPFSDTGAPREARAEGETVASPAPSTTDTEEGSEASPGSTRSSYQAVFSPSCKDQTAPPSRRGTTLSPFGDGVESPDAVHSGGPNSPSFPSPVEPVVQPPGDAGTITSHPSTSGSTRRSRPIGSTPPPHPSHPSDAFSSKGEEEEGDEEGHPLTIYPPDICASPLFKGGAVSPFGMEHALSVQKQGQRAIIFPKDSHLAEESDEESFSADDFHLVGDVKGRLCIVVDTIVDEGRDAAAVSRALIRNGAERVLVVATHPIFSGKAVERLKNAPIDLVAVSDSIHQDDVMKDPRMAQKLRIVPISPLLALAIEKIHTESKLSMLL